MRVGPCRQVLEVLGRSRVSKLVVMRSILSQEEEAHRPELYLELGNQDAWIDNDSDNGNGDGNDMTSDDFRVMPLGSGRRDVEGGVSAVVGGGGGGGEGAGVGRAAGAEEGSEAGSCGNIGSSRYHQQLRRYRDHLRREVCIIAMRSCVLFVFRATSSCCSFGPKKNTKTKVAKSKTKTKLKSKSKTELSFDV